VGDWTRALTPEEQVQVTRLTETARRLYAGVETPHRSCGIAMAETFGRATPAYQALRRGGITGCGECGVIVGARLVLGELFGDPDPTGPVAPALRTAMEEFEARWRGGIDRRAAPGDDIVCNTLTGQFADFRGPERHGFCTSLAADVAALLAEVVVRNA
jgi:hypothetical protein